MSPKTDKLAQRLQDVQKFVAARVTQDSTYPAIAQELLKVGDALKATKLNLHIYSRSAVLAQALKDSFNCADPRPEAFQLNTLPFPKQLPLLNSQPAASLVLTAASQPTHYSLSVGETVTIGRRPGNTIQLLDHYDRTSGNHAEIRPQLNPTPPVWQVCDLNSRNGTFVNGQKVQGCQTLEVGDRVTLGYPTASEKAPELVFEGIGSGQLDKFQQQLELADILCLVVSSGQPFSPEEQRLIEIASQAPLARCFVVMDTPRTGSEWQTENLSNAATIASWLKGQRLDQSVELVSLSLGLFDPNRQAGTMLDPGAQPDLVQFCQTLNYLVANNKAEEQIIRRSTMQLLRQIARIEQVLGVQETVTTRAIVATEKELSSSGQSELKEQIRKAVKKANEEREKFFRQVKIDLNQSRNDLLDKHRRNSILNKIQEFAASLTPVVTKQGSHTYLQLVSPGASGGREVNSAMTHLCRSELIQWGHEEWRKIGTSYAEGGYNAMLRRIYTALNIVPSLKLNDVLAQPIRDMQIDRHLDASVIEFDDKTAYQQVSLAGYLFKSTRSQVTGIMSMVTMVATIFGISFSQSNNNSGGGAAPYALLLGILFPIVVIFLIYSYHQEKDLKLRDEGEKLRDKISGNYQELAKGFVDRLKQAFDLRLDSEAQRLREATELVNEQLNTHAADLDKEQVQARTRLAEQKVRQTELRKERAELEKLKLV
ncbi:FHA domain-containing protein [Microcoleus sp. MOSTC5]|uniref:FHA domain-containing protein n=1 Tax=Microcoleus sp. MOSTC5 TaxID=3055378 RepID=UPI002FD71473